MSIYLKGDGAVYSSMAFDTVTLPNPAISPDILEDNVDIVETDAGYIATYEKGTYRRIFPYRFTLLTQTQRDDLWIWWQNIKGRSHWFLLQPQEQKTVSILETETGENTDRELFNQYIYLQSPGTWKGYWVFILAGNYRKEARKVISEIPTDDSVIVSPPFSGYILEGLKFILGYPVTLDQARFEATPRFPNFWDVELIFKERIIDKI
jgi:hypothetical protein